MVDNRSVSNVNSGFNFKSGDISGTAAKMNREKNGQGSEYYAPYEQEEEEERSNRFHMDRSSLLHDAMSSLALLNVANVVKTTLKTKEYENLNPAEVYAQQLKKDDEEV